MRRDALRRGRAPAGLLVGLGVAMIASSACFDPPAAAVLFRCTPGSDHACPDGYTCEADGCCHKDGTQVAEHLGECFLAGDGDSDSDLLDTGSDTGEETSTEGETDTDTESDSAT